MPHARNRTAPMLSGDIIALLPKWGSGLTRDPYGLEVELHHLERKLSLYWKRKELGRQINKKFY